MIKSNDNNNNKSRKKKTMCFIYKIYTGKPFLPGGPAIPCTITRKREQKYEKENKTKKKPSKKCLYLLNIRER